MLNYHNTNEDFLVDGISKDDRESIRTKVLARLAPENVEIIELDDELDILTRKAEHVEAMLQESVPLPAVGPEPGSENLKAKTPEEKCRSFRELLPGESLGWRS